MWDKNEMAELVVYFGDFNRHIVGLDVHGVHCVRERNFESRMLLVSPGEKVMYKYMP